jgi:hypothetical protein
MRVRHVVPFLLLLAAIMPASAPAAACPPRDCGSVATTVAGGGMVAVSGKNAINLFDLSTGKSRGAFYDAVLSADGRRAVVPVGRLLKTYDLASGRVVARTTVGAGWSLAGVSADAKRIVLVAHTNKTTRVGIRAGAKQQTLTFDGKFELDGLYGTRLYLIQYVKDGYYVRVADLATGKLEADPLKDADEPALIQGQAWTRVASHDGRYLFTVYINGQGAAMIHELDMREGKAWCVDLPGSGDYNAAASYAIALSRDESKLYAASSVYGAVVTVDVADHRVAHTAHFAPRKTSGPSMASVTVSPDGKTLAFSNYGDGVVFDLTADKIAKTLQLDENDVVVFAPSGLLKAASRSLGVRTA